MIGSAMRRLPMGGRVPRVAALFATLVCCAEIALCRGVKLKTIHYEYTIQVRSVGPGAANPATVELKWPKGTKTLSLSGAVASETVPIAWQQPYSTDPRVKLKILRFELHVAVSRAGFSPWRARYVQWDFVRVSKDVFRRVDRVTLHALPSAVTKEQLAALSLALPCGLDIYTRRRFEDFNGDGRPEAILTRRVQPSASRSPIAELQLWSLRGGKWVELFAANHRGIFISGTPVKGTGPAPHGYHCRGIGEPGPGDVAMGKDGHLLIVGLCRADEDGKRRRAEARDYLWRKGEQTLSPQPVRRRLPR